MSRRYCGLQNACDRPQENDKGIRRLLQRLKELLVTAQGKVVLAGYPVPQPETHRDFVLGLVHELFSQGLDDNLVHRDCALGSPLRRQPIVAGGDGNIDLIAGASKDGPARVFQNAYDGEPSSVDSDWLAQRDSDAEQRLGYIRSQHRHLRVAAYLGLRDELAKFHGEVAY